MQNHYKMTKWQEELWESLEDQTFPDLVIELQQEL